MRFSGFLGIEGHLLIYNCFVYIIHRESFTSVVEAPLERRSISEFIIFRTRCRLIFLNGNYIINVVYYCDRFQLTARDCPSNLLRKLRLLSKCICDRPAPRYSSTEFYVRLNSIRFSTSSWVEPQYNNSKVSSSSVYLQYHFCTYKNNCTDKKFRRENCFRSLNNVNSTC